MSLTCTGQHELGCPLLFFCFRIGRPSPPFFFPFPFPIQWCMGTRSDSRIEKLEKSDFVHCVSIVKMENSLIWGFRIVEMQVFVLILRRCDSLLIATWPITLQHTSMLFSYVMLSLVSLFIFSVGLFFFFFFNV